MPQLSCGKWSASGESGCVLLLRGSSRLPPANDLRGLAGRVALRVEPFEPCFAARRLAADDAVPALERVATLGARGPARAWFLGCSNTRRRARRAALPRTARAAMRGNTLSTLETAAKRPYCAVSTAFDPDSRIRGERSECGGRRPLGAKTKRGSRGENPSRAGSALAGQSAPCVEYVSEGRRRCRRPGGFFYFPVAETLLEAGRRRIAPYEPTVPG